MTKPIPLRSLALAAALALTACGSTTPVTGGGGNDGSAGSGGNHDGGGDATETGGDAATELPSKVPAQPRLILGGGVGDGPIDGVLNVYVTDDDTRGRVSGATVRVGASADPAACTATTDSTGLVVFSKPTCTLLKGKQSITASASGYAPTTWIGVNAANVTLSIRATTTPPFETAAVTGTITGFDKLPAPAAQHNLLGFVGPSASPDLSDAANNLPQGTRAIQVQTMDGPVMIQFPANVCVRNVVVNDCSWHLKTRVGAQAHYAVVVDQDTKGTDDDDTDDTFTVIGWAVKRGLNFSKDQGADGEALTLLTDDEMQPFSVTFPTPPAGLDFVQAFPILTLGAEGRIAVTLPALDLAHLMTRVPKLGGVFAGAKYDFLAKVQDAKDKDQPASLGWAHGIDAAKPVTALNWLALPTALKAEGGTYSFLPVAGATVHGGELLTTAGKRAWSITIFDGTTSFTLPGVSPDPLPVGDARFSVSALVIPGFKPDDVKLDDLRDTITHISNDQITFTH